ncbi:MAG TPA: DUF6599 family protein, partial [Anaerolineae bacterium]
DRLFDLVDGSAEGYFAYGFEQVSLQRYAAGTDKAGLQVEIWQLASPADAYGLFSTARSGDLLTVGQASGQNASLNSGHELSFWQARDFVRVRTFQDVPDADLQAFARLVSAALPAGAAAPALMQRLPSAGQVAGSQVFFRRELSIQGRVWLGEENVLGLGPTTEGALADYTVPDGAVSLVLVRYPAAAAAAAGLAALQAGKVDGVAVARAKGDLLAAVFGTVDPAAAEKLVSAALR